MLHIVDYSLTLQTGVTKGLIDQTKNVRKLSAEQALLEDVVSYLKANRDDRNSQMIYSTKKYVAK